MSEEFFTVKQIAAKTGLAEKTIANYAGQLREPYLKVAKRVVVNGSRLEIRIARADFEAWWQEYSAKKPTGARAHKKRGV
jgi:hypothetical protein